MNRQTGTLEELLQAKGSYGLENEGLTPIKKTPIPSHTQAEENADLDDFLTLVSEVTTKALKKQNVKFCPDEGERIVFDEEFVFDRPHITYEIISCEPLTELKPRVRREIIEPVHSDNKTLGRHGRVFGQKFKSIVQFNIFGCDYVQATKVMKDFEDIIFRYTAYFKKKGVAEILFQRRYTDKNYDAYRQKISIRSLQYYVETERNYIQYSSDMIPST